MENFVCKIYGVNLFLVSVFSPTEIYSGKVICYIYLNLLLTCTFMKPGQRKSINSIALVGIESIHSWLVFCEFLEYGALTMYLAWRSLMDLVLLTLDFLVDRKSNRIKYSSIARLVVSSMTIRWTIYRVHVHRPICKWCVSCHFQVGCHVIVLEDLFALS